MCCRRGKVHRCAIRSRPIKLFPLSFKEYCEGRRESLSELFLDYMEQGGLPLALSVSAKERQDVLENLYDSILLHSLVENLRYADSRTHAAADRLYGQPVGRIHLRRGGQVTC